MKYHFPEPVTKSIPGFPIPKSVEMSEEKISIEDTMRNN